MNTCMNCTTTFVSTLSTCPNCNTPVLEEVVYEFITCMDCTTTFVSSLSTCPNCNTPVLEEGAVLEFITEEEIQAANRTTWRFSGFYKKVHPHGFK